MNEIDFLNLSTLRFLTFQEVEMLHAEQLDLFGGQAGYVDRTVVESAVAMPSQAMFGQYLHEDIASMAAAYLFHLAASQGFNDGNKRTAVLCATTFLRINGFRHTGADLEMYDLTMSIANREADKETAAEWIRERLVPTT